MEKVMLILLALVAIAFAASLRSAELDSSQECLYTDQMWGGPDPRNVYFCVDGTVYEESCRANSYFVKNATVSGCVPASLMNPNCINSNKIGNCEGNNLQQPQASNNISSFYLCQSAGATPVELSCPPGKGFINQDGYLGCFLWPLWHQIRNCTT